MSQHRSATPKAKPNPVCDGVLQVQGFCSKGIALVVAPQILLPCLWEFDILECTSSSLRFLSNP